MKKTIAWILTLMLCLSGAAAQAASLPQAAQQMQLQTLERYPAYALDVQSGWWSVRTNEADALVARLWEDGAQYAESMCVFALETEGQAQTGLLIPVLRVYYSCGTKPTRADAVALLSDGVRYDFAACSEVVKNGRTTVEVVSVPLTQEAFAAVCALRTAQSVSLRLMGESVVTAEFDLSAAGARRQVEAASLSGLDSALTLLGQLGADAYALWDLSAAAWENIHGFAPAFARTQVTNVIGETETTDAFGMVAYGDRSKAAQAARQALTDAGFMLARTATEFDETASAAARRAQHYLGRIENGCVDAALLEALRDGAVAQETAVAPEMEKLADTAEIALDRYWFAGAVSAAQPADGLRTVSNTDNALLIADGTIRNLSQTELRLFMHVEARVIYNDTYAYDAVLLCERDQGTALDTALLPLGTSRLIVYAEVPASLAEDADAAWRLEISVNDDKLEYELQ